MKKFSLSYVTHGLPYSCIDERRKVLVFWNQVQDQDGEQSTYSDPLNDFENHDGNSSSLFLRRDRWSHGVSLVLSPGLFV